MSYCTFSSPPHVLRRLFGNWGLGCVGRGGGEGLLVVILPGSRRSPSDVIVPYLLVLVMPGSLSGAQGPGHPHLPLVAERRPVGADRPAAAGTGQQRRQGQKTREVAPPPGAGRRLLRRTRRYPLARAPGRLPAGWAPSTASSCASAAPGVEAGARRPARAGKSGPRARPRPHGRGHRLPVRTGITHRPPRLPGLRRRQADQRAQAAPGCGHQRAGADRAGHRRRRAGP